MELSHLLNLVAELPENNTLSYVRGTDTCKHCRVDIPGKRIFSETPTGEEKSWAPSYLEDLAPKIKENVPFNLSGLLNNKGSFRPVLETTIAHTREFYTVRKGSATALVWIPTKPKESLELMEIDSEQIPAPLIENPTTSLLNPQELISKVRDGFELFLTLTNKQMENRKSYIKELDDRLTEKISQQFPNISSIYEIVSASELESRITTLITTDNSLLYLQYTNWNDTKDTNPNYKIWTTYRQYINYLKILEISDFRANIVDSKNNLLSVESHNLNNKDKDYLRAMRTKPFLLLAGISGTGKSRIVKQMAFESCPDNAILRKDPTSPGNYCLVEVKPNWHDSTELLGYESKIGGDHYQLTPFIKFLAKAMLHPDTPFFVCLDEMNLAPVEQYFAEFLSVLESRTKIYGHIVSEPLIKADIFKKYSLENQLFGIKGDNNSNGTINSTSDPCVNYGKEYEVYVLLKKDGLRIPENVVIIGTVNMDETTHQFSRKVIDRAMTIEMNLPEGNPFMDFFSNSSELAYREQPTNALLYFATETKASDVVNSLASENADKTEWLKGEVANFLTRLNDAIDGTPFKVAYRVQNELILYFYQLWLEDKTAEWENILNTACDQILMMKVLPRIEGDSELLEIPLTKLISFCAPYTNASKKLDEMNIRLDKSQFTSFWP